MPADMDLVGRMALAANHLAVVATTRPDGTVHPSLVSAGVFDDPVTNETGIAMVVGGDAAKLRHLRHAGRAAAVFQAGWQWAAVEGPVRIAGPHDLTEGVTAEQVPDLLRRIFVAAGGTHEDWAEFDRVMAAQRRTAVFIQPHRVTGSG